MTDIKGDLQEIWSKGYSIAELWGASKPVSRETSGTNDQHLILWGILSIVEYQVDKGAGHNYLRNRLLSGDWLAVGMREPKTSISKLQIVPPIQNAKFGRKSSAIGDGAVNYVDVRVIHGKLVTPWDAD
jgi:hypothetical protein